MKTVAYADDDTIEAKDSGMIWAAVIGGALAALGLTIILFPIGTALGIQWLSPWPHAEAGKAISVMGAVWVVLVQWLSSGFGGYLTGRLRTKWSGAHTNEVYFRDTVHGFMSWALATVLGAILITVILSHAVHGAQRGENSPQAYYTDSLFRSDHPTTEITDQDRREAARILAKGTEGTVANADANYLTRLVATRTGMSATEADARIDTVLTQQKDALEKIRKRTTGASLLTSLTLLIGAFIAAVCGALGGIHRDTHYVTGRLRD